MAEPFEITTDLISFYSEYSVVMMRYSFLIYKYIYMQMLTAHNGQLASFVCVMSYVFKFSIAYIHVYNDEKKPWTVMVRGFSCTCNKQEGKRFQITSVTVLLSLSNIPAICHSFPCSQKPLHTTICHRTAMAIPKAMPVFMKHGLTGIIMRMGIRRSRIKINTGITIISQAVRIAST